MIKQDVKYICDNCKSEVELKKLYLVSKQGDGTTSRTEKVSDICEPCYIKAFGKKRTAERSK